MGFSEYIKDKICVILSTHELCCRYMNGDEDDLPDWFRKDEKKFNSMPVIVERVSGWEAWGAYRQKWSLCLFFNVSNKIGIHLNT